MSGHAGQYQGLSQFERDLYELSPTTSPPGTPQPGPRPDSWQAELIGMYSDREGPRESASYLSTQTPHNGTEDNLNLVSEPRTPEKTHNVYATAQQRHRRRKWFIIGGIVALVVIAVAVAVPLALLKSNSSSSSSSPKSGSGAKGATSGISGSEVTMADGTTFTYVNDYGGEWQEDPTQPFGPGGKAQSWSPRVGEEEWVWGTHVARGVNLGGWLVTEPFISPALYEKYVGKSDIFVVDEYTLCMAMGENVASEMEEHYKTFITEKDFADIAGAGLNWVRIPVGFWAIETIGDEPFLAGTSWSYFLKAIQWARKYGLRIMLDLHAIPGSQNGWNHSGKAGSVNFMHGVMGLANAQRTLTYLRIFTEFISQEQYRDVVPIIGIVNEILWDTIGESSVQSFYFGAYEALRTSTGIGQGKGPYIAVHDGFQGLKPWESFLSGADRLAIDQHPYLAFRGDSSPVEQMAPKPCEWAIATNQSQTAFGVTLGGEFSAAINDCGLWLNGIGSTPANPNCDIWDDWNNYNQTVIDNLKQVTLATMDALQNFFFWTWRIGDSTELGTSSSPMWHYKLGMEKGWVPKDPREASGHCASVLGSSQLFDGQHPATATGGNGAGTIEAAQTASHAFPPPSMSPSFSAEQMSLLPTYTPTGTIKTLFAPSFTGAPDAAVGTGWNNPDDTELAYVTVAGCSYPDPWNAVSAPLPTASCTGA